jgi:hypothetical protein
MLKYHRIRLAAVRNKGDCPCPRCLIHKNEIHKIGQVMDAKRRLSNARSYPADLIAQARRFIYKLGRVVTSVKVERLLKPHSWVPTSVS